MPSYSGVDRRHSESGFKVTKTIDLGTILTFIGILITLLAFSNKIENRITTVENKVDFIMRSR